MNKREINKNWAKEIDKKFSDLKTEYGAIKTSSGWKVTLWQPLAKNVELIIYCKDNQNKEIQRIKGVFNSPNWGWDLKENLDGYFYHYLIMQESGKTNLALDPFAKSMASFNWEGKDTNIGKAAFVDLTKKVELTKLNKINNPQPLIYEAHVRDITSLQSNVDYNGSFNAIEQINFGKYLKDIGITHLQLLPVHNCYALNENDKQILNKSKGAGWNTNYNWGYDPHNYFSINGWYSTRPNDPYSRINEFNSFVKHMHKNGIKVILDVVYNHMFSNKILNNILPGYFYREGSTTTPVSEVALASERVMTRRIIIDSLKWFVEMYDVDGFRFDLLTFIDLETIELLTKVLRNIKPNIVLHGEAWDFTDLKKTNSLNKGFIDNDYDFAYFNDTIRDSIKGHDDGKDFSSGLVNGNKDMFKKYVSSIIGNIKNFKHDLKDIDTDSYNRWTNYPNNLLNYTACHDGHTLWDKINLTTKGNFIEKLEIYRQALMMMTLVPGRILYLGGTEILYTKPNDISGQDFERSHHSEDAYNLFGLGKTFNENSYKTTDYTNGLRWDESNILEINKYVKEFFTKLNNLRTSTNYFNMRSEDEINSNYKFNKISGKDLIIDFEVASKDKSLRIIHNFSEKEYKYYDQGRILLDSKINNKNIIGISLPISTHIIERNKNE